MMATNRLRAIIGRVGSAPPEEVTFSAMMFLSLGDQPERRGGNFLLAGNSRSHTRWRYVGDLWRLKNVLPACKTCYANMRMADVTDDAELPDWVWHHCDKCTNWMMGNLNQPLLSYPRPSDYPKGYLLGGDVCNPNWNKLNPSLLSYNSLKTVVSLAHDNVVSGTWIPKESLCFLKENGINEEYRTLIVKRAKRSRQYLLAFERQAEEPLQYQNLQRLRQKYPNRYCRAPIPSVWQRDLPLNLFVDTPMHLLFLGIAKSVFFKIGVWSARCGRGPAFRKIAIRLLSELESLKLGWLTFNVKSFDTWGGWVSEKYQSLARVALWVYGPLTILDDVAEFVEPTDRPIDKWLVGDYKKWLKVRGLPHEGKKAEVQQEVLRQKAMPIENQTKILPPQHGSAEGMMTMLRSMLMMLATILQPAVSGESHSKILALRVRLFLSALEEFDEPLRKKIPKKGKEKGGLVATIEGELLEGAVGVDDHREDTGERHENEEEEGKEEEVFEKEALEDLKKPLWLARCNFLCLLNLPDTLRKFGSPRNYFEGKYLGERYVQEVKNARLRCPHKNVCENLMRKLHQGKSLQAMINSQLSREVKPLRMEGETTTKKSLSGNVRVYKTMDAATVAFLSSLPVSILETGNAGHGILFYTNGSNRGDIKFMRLEKEEIEGSYHGMRFWKWRRTDNIFDLESLVIKDYAVLLPKYARAELDGSADQFTLVTKEWSPLMLQHYNFSTTGIDTKPTLEMKDDDEVWLGQCPGGANLLGARSVFDN